MMRPLFLVVWMLSSMLVVDPELGRAQLEPTSDADIQVLERLAEERYNDGDLERAAELYLEIASRQSGTQAEAKALFTAAWLIDLSGDQTRALEMLTRSLTIDPGQPFDPSLYNRRFELLYRQATDLAQTERRQRSGEKTTRATRAIIEGRDAEARSLLASALDLDPDNPSARYNLALLDLSAGASDKALEDFERVVSLTYRQTDGNMAELRAKALTSIGIIYQQQDRSQDAEQSYLEATRADATEPSAWSHLGWLQLEQGRFADAVAALEHAYELQPSDRIVIDSLARGLAAAGRPGDAVSRLDAFLQAHPEDAGIWLLLAEIERDQGQTDAARQALDNCIEADAQNRGGHASAAAAQLARIHLESGDTDEALLAANQALGWSRTDAAAWGILGEAQAAAGQIPQAIASLNRAAELDPESVERQVTLADTMAADGQWQDAEAAYLRALTLDPDSAAASAGLASVRQLLAGERAIVIGTARPRKPIPPKKIGLEFAGIDYKDLQLRGALVKNVNKKSPAARAGLRKGDLILWIGDYSVLSDKDFYQYLKRNPPSDTVAIEYLRDGRIHDTEIEMR